MAYATHDTHIATGRGKTGFRDAWRTLVLLPHIAVTVFKMVAHPERYSLDDDC